MLYIGEMWKYRIANGWPDLKCLVIELPGNGRVQAGDYRMIAGTMAASLTSEFKGLERILFLVRNVGLYMNEAELDDQPNAKLRFHYSDNDGWIVSGLWDWFESKNIKMPELRFAEEVDGEWFEAVRPGF